MDRQKLSTIAHSDHPFSAPISDANAARLLRRARCASAGARILDIGCAEAAWLIAALEMYPDATAVGVDISAGALEKARREADRRGVGDRLELRTVDAREIPAERGYDLVLCVGSTHALGGLAPTLQAVRGHVRDGGVALVGDGFWAKPPSDDALRAFGVTADEFSDLPGLVDTVEKAGWTPVYGHVSDDGEWDDYEWSWTGSLARWAIDNNEPEALAAAREHRDGWLRGYRGTLGFVCLLLQAMAVTEAPSRT